MIATIKNAHAAVHAPARRTCAGCGASYADREWGTLEVTERIAPRDVRRNVRDWPEALCVEVRRCGRCGRGMAAKREVRAP